ncbi:ABC transporter substrate-binding protein [Candidatus Poriferisocius sp.]|uniref:ABC transporter substrate-binding protein n=1 Tax=Candidatus Poriferisocius sp. TaxID=3101276 RepID=UPI003B017D99
MLYKLLALLAALLLATAACGNDDDGTDAADPPATTKTAIEEPDEPAPATEEPDEPAPDSTAAEASDDRPSYCRYYDTWADAEARSRAIEAEHGEDTTTWPSGELEQWADAMEARGDAAERMWDAAPSDYTWDDVHRECGDSDDPLPTDDGDVTIGSRTYGAFTYSIDFEPSTRGVTDDTVRFGAMTQSALYSGYEDGIKARLERANRDGELPGGRQAELVQFVDDGSDPQANFDGARSMVENDEVFGIMVTSAVSLPQTTDYLNDNQVPFTGWGFMPGFCAPNEWGFGFNGCLSGFAFEVEGAHPLVSVREIWNDYLGNDDFSVGIFNSDDDAGRAGAGLYETLWGDRLAFSDFVPTQTAGGITDPTRFVNRVLEANPELVILSTDFAGAVTLKAAIAASGWDGPVADYLTYVPGLPQSSPDLGQALEGGFAATQVPPLDETQPAIQLLLADFEAVDAFPGFGSLVGYWSADLMVQMVAAAGEDLNTASFYQAINLDGFESTQQPGGLGAVRFPVDHVIAPDCISAVQVVDGDFEVAHPFTCYGEPDR